MSPAQCRAARALLNLSHADLAGRAVVPISAIIDFETDAATLRAADLAALKAALEREGVELLNDVGVKLSR